MYISAELSINMLTKESKVSILVGDMVRGASAKHIVLIRAHKVGDRNIIIKVFINNYLYKLIYQPIIYNRILSFIMINRQTILDPNKLRETKN